MKLSLQQLPQHLTKNLAAIYILSGDESLLTQEASDLIRDSAQKQGFSERVSLSVDSGNEWGKILYSEAQSLSLFATKRILELNLTNAKFNHTTSELLQDYALKPSADTVLIIQTNKIDSKTEQSKWYQALEKNCVVVPVWPVASAQLPQWILQRAKKNNLTLTQQAAEFLAQQVEGNLLAAAQEIEKLSLLATSDVIDIETIESLATDNAHFDIFDLVDSALLGNKERSLRIAKNLAETDTEPTLVLWALARELRTLAELAKQVKQNSSLSSLFSKFRIWEKRQAAVRAFLQRHSQQSCWKLLVEAARIDRMIKGVEEGNVWDELQRLVMKI